MAKQLKINGCIGCQACVLICPELFEMDDDRQVHNVYGDEAEIPEDLETNAIEASESCPVSAIIIK